ncbi:MAG: ABC transporter substrate-binding protein [Oligoflexia bacterium]|nr:ABC transporter substrate-binding protein [Oligoflexia bacterium]
MKSSLILVPWILLLLITACSQTPTHSTRKISSSNSNSKSTTSDQSGSDLYTDQVIKSLKQIKILYDSGKRELAFKQIQEIKDGSLLPTEKALKYNLAGVFNFANSNYDEALKNFQEALTTSNADSLLTTQIYLNLSSSHYKKRNFEVSKNLLKEINFASLKDQEIYKYFRLKFFLAEEDKDSEAIIYLAQYLSKYKNSEEILADSVLYNKFTTMFSQIEDAKKLEYVQKIAGQKIIKDNFNQVGFLILNLVEPTLESLYFSGKKDEYMNMLTWVKSVFSEQSNEVAKINSLENKILNLSTLNANNIGIILPFTGEKAKFAHKAMLGIEAAIKEMGGSGGTNESIKQIIRDSRGNGIVGLWAVRELVEKYGVGIIIGGLFPEEAQKEYLEAKKYGVFFISLSPIFLPKSEKNLLLLEIQGSVESQIKKIFTPSLIERLGNKIAVLYPEEERGQAYVNELWSEIKNHNPNIKITAVQSYNKNDIEYIAPIKKLLGMDFVKEREEEQEVVNKINTVLSSHKKGDRKNFDLTPVVDFDWLFVPSYPDETQRLVPTFKYVDAPKITFVGISSWRSKSLSKLSERQAFYFVGDDFDTTDKNLTEAFNSNYGMVPGLIETISHNAMVLGLKLLAKSSEAQITGKSEFNNMLRTLPQLDIAQEKWINQNNLWVKDMAFFKFGRGEITKFNGSNSNHSVD